MIPITATTTAQMAVSPPMTWKAFIPAERYRSAARGRGRAAAAAAPARRGRRGAAGAACAGAASDRCRRRRRDSSPAGSGSARTAHQTSQSSATIGIFSTTTIQMKPQVMCGDGTRHSAVASTRVSDPGLFGPESVTWRVNREGVLLLGGGAAIIMQVAHPLVGRGRRRALELPRGPVGPAVPDARPDHRHGVRLDGEGARGVRAPAGGPQARARADEGGRRQVPGGHEVLGQRPEARHVGARDARGHVDAGVHAPTSGRSATPRSCATTRSRSGSARCSGCRSSASRRRSPEFYEYFDADGRGGARRHHARSRTSSTPRCGRSFRSSRARLSRR